MKKSKFKVEALVFSLFMAASLIAPFNVNGQSGGVDGFFGGGSYDYENRDDVGTAVAGGITNESFNAPVGNGLLILLAAGACYVAFKRRKALTIVCALTLLAGTTQCRKEKTVPYDNKAFGITLDVGEGSKSIVTPSNGHVTFVDGDEVLVSNYGRYVGRLTYANGVFSGTITDPSPDDYLYFYHLGNAKLDELVGGSSTECRVSITHQIQDLPVISYGRSSVKFSTSITNYEALLRNKCALVKFNVSTQSEFAATCIKGMNNVVCVDFAESLIEYEMEDEGKITLAPGNGERWAIVLPQNEKEAGDEGTAFSGRYIGCRGAMPEIHENDCVDNGIDVVVNSLTSPAGALPGEFTVNSSGKKVVFSKANLAYNRTKTQWEFLSEQNAIYEYNTSNVGQNYNDSYTKITLFEWGHSGYDHGAVSYLPDHTNSGQNDYYAYGDPACNLEDHTGMADWGYNAIANGGNTNKQWRTMTGAEWAYIFTGRDGADEKYAFGTVNGNRGLIILPDEWILPSGSSFAPGVVDNWTTNNYSSDAWAPMENAGAVFLVTAGRRMNRKVDKVYEVGWYWSSTAWTKYNAYGLRFSLSGGVTYNNSNQRNAGFSVRLVCE